MTNSTMTGVLLIVLATAGFGAGLSLAASPDAKHNARHGAAHHQAGNLVSPLPFVG